MDNLLGTEGKAAATDDTAEEGLRGRRQAESPGGRRCMQGTSWSRPKMRQRRSKPELKKGADFAALAKEKSKDPAARPMAATSASSPRIRWCRSFPPSAFLKPGKSRSREVAISWRVPWTKEKRNRKARTSSRSSRRSRPTSPARHRPLAELRKIRQGSTDGPGLQHACARRRQHRRRTRGSAPRTRSSGDALASSLCALAPKSRGSGSGAPRRLGTTGQRLHRNLCVQHGR